MWPPTLTLLHLLIARHCFKIITNTNSETSPQACKMWVSWQSTERGLSHQSCWATKSRWWVCMFFSQHFIQNHRATVWDLGFKAKVVLFKRVLRISSWVFPDADSLIQLFFVDESRSYVAANVSSVSERAMCVTRKNITFDGKFQVCFILKSSTVCQRGGKSYP